MALLEQILGSDEALQQLLRRLGSWAVAEFCWKPIPGYWNGPC